MAQPWRRQEEEEAVEEWRNKLPKKMQVREGRKKRTKKSRTDCAFQGKRVVLGK